uniref:Transmembrane protein TMEM132 sixth domain-containing protein n=1 Tax=Knipowitschia caucasica TaxID=637954 RepID=A0AAV2J903_KNICA
MAESSDPQVESPLAVDAVLGEASFSVTDDKVSIAAFRVHAIAGLSLTVQPSPGNSHTMVARAAGVQTLTAPKQCLGGFPLRLLAYTHTALSLCHGAQI